MFDTWFNSLPGLSKLGLVLSGSLGIAGALRLVKLLARPWKKDPGSVRLPMVVTIIKMGDTSGAQHRDSHRNLGRHDEYEDDISTECDTEDELDDWSPREWRRHAGPRKPRRARCSGCGYSSVHTLESEDEDDESANLEDGYQRSARPETRYWRPDTLGMGYQPSDDS